jgi:quinol monooxygenase YgiN
MVVIARLKVRGGKEQEMEGHLKDMVKKVAAEEGTLLYTVLHSTQDPAQYVIYEKYTDQDAFTRHATSPHFAAFSKAIGGLLSGPPEIQIYEEIAELKK